MPSPPITDAQKQSILEQLYRIYDQYIDSVDIACAKYCHDCCTSNVVMTTLEGKYILSGMSSEQQIHIMALIQKQLGQPRFIPALTTNRIAQACHAGAEPPEEQVPADSGSCPLLHEGTCRIYAVRPFGCRCMMSSAPCRKTGWAETDPFTLTVNTVFLQVIEHIDREGFTGNLCDVLARIYAEKNPESAMPRTTGLTSNAPLCNLFIPAEHHDRVMPIISAIRELSI